jgi:fibronectin type 3 domain-containing protein
VPQIDYPAPDNASADSYATIQATSLTFTPLGLPLPVTQPLEPKAIQELFELDYGRMNATLGVELPFTNFNIQTTIPLGYKDPVTETLQDNGTQIWKITHNGVDTHPVHFHLFNVQIINRVGWDGAIRPPDPNELGWKETVKMNPLEDIIVAMKPVKPTLPFSVPDSIRPLDPTMPVGATITLSNPADGNPLTTTNDLTNFGWEFVWHCHILGHEENDFMRPMVFLVPQIAPGAPTGLGAAVPNPYQIDLTWADTATNEIGFRIERSVGLGTFEAFMTVPANSVAFSDTSVVPGLTYSYQVLAFNTAGSSAFSNSVTVALPVAVPKAPTQLNATASGPYQVNLTWNDTANNETNFRVERAEGAGSFTTIATLGPDATAYSDTTVSPLTVYTYRVFAYNPQGDSTASNSIELTTPDIQPTAPAGLGATAASAYQINLAWTDTSANETGFRIERAVGTGAFSPYATVGANVSAYSDTVVAPATSYSYRVVAYNSGGDSPASNIATAATPDIVPTACSGLVAMAISPSTVFLAWTDTSANEAGFRIERAVGTDAFAPLSMVAASVIVYFDSAAAPATSYSYRVVAYNSAGDSSPSNTVTATTPAAPTTTTTTSIPACNLNISPGTIGGRMLSMLAPIRRITLRSLEGSELPDNPDINWGTDAIQTLSARAKDANTIIAWVLIRPMRLTANETFTVTVGDCTGEIITR